MPGEIALLKTVIELAASDAVMRGAKAVWTRLPWARDQKKTQAAERLTQALVDDVAGLARALPPTEVEAGIDRTLDRYERDLQREGLKPDEARLIRGSVQSQLRAAVLGPIGDIRQLQSRFNELETTLAETQRDLELERRRHAEIERRLSGVFLLALAAALLAAFAIGIVFARR